MQGGFEANGVDSGTSFSDIDLGTKVCNAIHFIIGISWQLYDHAFYVPIVLMQEWTDYDEKSANPVSIFELTHRFIKL